MFNGAFRRFSKHTHRLCSSNFSATAKIGDNLARPLRSVLFTPGYGKHLKKVKRSIADCTIIDLEDGVAPSSKDSARSAVAKMFKEESVGNRMMTIRINGRNTEWRDKDLEEISKIERVDAIALPKVECADEVREVAEYLAKNSASKNMNLWGFIETPKGVQNVDEIACAHPMLSVLVMGTSDLSRDLQCLHTRDRLPLLYSLSKCIVAAKANKLQILDGVHLNLDDSSGFEQSCRQGKEMGMNGKSLIHPSTIAIANWFFGPSAEEVELSFRILEAMSEASQKGEGVCVVDGHLVENLHAENARRIISLHEAIQSFEDTADA
mmetsp:Transcript_19181/g.28303  ORF Transcript_19181/g.28303 Transcript_19181/m.28303 type:complete len:323 (+) Transcript_19181:115-1083(+)